MFLEGFQNNSNNPKKHKQNQLNPFQKTNLNSTKTTLQKQTLHKSLQSQSKQSILKSFLLTKCLDRARSDREKRIEELRKKQLNRVGLQTNEYSSFEQQITSKIQDLEKNSQKSWPSMIQKEIDSATDFLELNLNEEDYQDIMIALEQQMIDEREQLMKMLRKEAEEYEDYEDSYNEYLLSTFPKDNNLIRK
ncbi:rpa-interacting protein rpain [Anaeramoeba flamelloides]|uniref:Rpa-interacting protein rpain n=1 Tax=Anaeramoeba flamelloides TaxID=1746091 RepID=A0ABQ8Z5A0_9EUKA|nr:rpa-interacting protein rpain [Anaeramoeba flamelloides]